MIKIPVGLLLYRENGAPYLDNMRTIWVSPNNILMLEKEVGDMFTRIYLDQHGMFYTELTPEEIIQCILVGKEK